MAQKKETVFRKKVVEYLKNLKHTHFFSIQQSSIVGTPDILVCIKGRFVALELKSANKEAKGIQKYNLDKINECGGVAYTVFPGNWESIKTQLAWISV